MKHGGGWLIAFGAMLGLAVAIYNYVTPVGFLSPYSNVAGTGGALLVIASTAIMLVAGLMLGTGVGNTFLLGFLVIGCLLDALGTGLAAYLLDSLPLVGAMAVCLLGWLSLVFRPWTSKPA